LAARRDGPPPAALAWAAAAAAGLMLGVGHALVVASVARAASPTTRGAALAATEAAWRAARWRFLRRAARRLGAGSVATAHTEDDQAETVAIRLLRGAGPRGLAGLLATRPGIVRPLVAVSAGEVAAYVAARGLRWVEDPGNASRRHLRNRLRHDLLPALERVRPGFRGWLLALGREAAAWRRDAESLAAAVPARRGEGGALHVAASALAGYDAAGLAVLWPALAARGGVRLDRRGTARLVAFTIRVAAEAAAVGARIPLAGGAEVAVRRGRRVSGDVGPELVLRKQTGPAARMEEVGGADAVPLADGTTLGDWRFDRRPRPADRADAWGATLPADRPLVVRPWAPGDRIAGAGRGGPQAARKVKRFLAEAGVPAEARPAWPVVAAVGPDGASREVLWVPGVCRSDAATGRPETPGQHFFCERIDRRQRRRAGG
ncbi:tRNA lysidine(34) synthetase TilS, partial [Roseisolibacter sp. H3M3-2]|uniref:tRNA lysidine(34) synthetase TilS n=1 Tax=Roseisolibacter sp. H3M3-2 TaxID=3031323 RepID=UPI0023D9EC73